MNKLNINSQNDRMELKIFWRSGIDDQQNLNRIWNKISVHNEIQTIKMQFVSEVYIVTFKYDKTEIYYVL